MTFLEKLFGDPNVKTRKTLEPIVEKINSLEPSFKALTDDALKAKTGEFKDRLLKGETLDDILPEAFATVREAGRRVQGMRHYDVQLMGGIALHQGKIAEMRTGEGKTLVATLPAYLNALEGKGVHVITVNDYLAKRDAVWMGHIYSFLGLSVGIVQNLRVSFQFDTSQTRPTQENTSEEKETDSFKIEDEFLRPISRKEAYACDITYGTNNEYGFDYLRDNMVQDVGEMVMRHGNEMNYAVIDEIDSILIDEARTPLIISAPAEEAGDQYYHFATLVKQLVENEDYNVDEKMRSAALTDAGIEKFETWLGVENIYVEAGVKTVHHIEQALKAEVLFRRDKDYVVDGDEIMIIDEFTGRKMPGRRYSEGLHQAIEAKEKVKIQRESQTLATITFQNLFRMYKKLSGMTGTAATEKEEFYKIYGLDVFILPTNRPDNRTDHPDRIYKNRKGKYAAVVERIKECREKGQPILIGTISVEKNEELSAYLTAYGIEHEVLNAKNHEREGEIIAQAGRPGAVTLATNMAGRGVDIKLGGNPINKTEEEKVLASGGLFVLGTERHESRRIDNQLRGRAARQGDVGETQFLVSTEDDLMRIFAGDRLKGVMERLNVPEDMPIEQSMITKMLETAQKKVESHHYDTRKHLLEYDDVLNRHREVIYKKRRQVLDLNRPDVTGVTEEKAEETLDSSDMETREESHGWQEETFGTLKEMVLHMVEREVEYVVTTHTNPTAREDGETSSDWNVKEIHESASAMFPLTEEDRNTIVTLGTFESGKIGEVEARERLVLFLMEKAKTEYEKIEKKVLEQAGNPEDAKNITVSLERSILLRSVDTLWVDHLVSSDHLRTGIGLRGYGQRDPLVEYKKEMYFLFNQLLSDIQKEVVYSFFKVGVGLQIAPSIMATDTLVMEGAKKQHDDTDSNTSKQVIGEHATQKHIGRNEPCHCGSGKKFKKCHGA